jgi:hypothetical protein
MPSVIEQTVQFSDLSRSSKRVAEAADRGPVTITRRDGEPLVLQRKSEVERDRRGLAVAAQIIAAAVSDQPEPFSARLTTPFPWITLLPEEERQQFADELVAVARACAALSAFEPLATTISAWRSTADAYARGYTPDAELDWLDDATRVSRPADEA